MVRNGNSMVKGLKLGKMVADYVKFSSRRGSLGIAWSVVFYIVNLSSILIVAAAS